MLSLKGSKYRYLLLSAVIAIAFSINLSAGFRVISEGENYTEIEFIMPEFEVTEVEQDGVTYQRFYHPRYGLIMEEGMPEVLSFSFLLSIPETGVVEIGDYDILETDIRKGINLFPSQGFNLEIDENSGFIKDNDFYGKEVDYPETFIQISSPSIMRDMRLVSVNINPMTYSPARKELTLNKRVTLRVNYNLNVAGENEIRGRRMPRSRTFERLQQGTVLNYNQFRNPGTRSDYQARSIIVVHHHTNDAQYVNALNNILNWKRDKGFEVATVTTATHSTNTAIRNYIRQAYNTWENPPEYVILVGDVTSNVSVPTFIEHQNAYIARHVRGDHPYSLMDGDDLLADVVVGRISIGSGFQLATFWNKLRNYERTPFMANTDWYEHQLLVGDRREGFNNTGISGFFTTRYIRDIMRRYYNGYSFTEVYDVPFPAQMQAGINQGASFFSFRGMYGLAGWNPGEDQFTNGYMLPNVSALTCRSLDYEGVWGFSLGHQFRMGTPTTARGFMSAIGISASSDTAFNNLLTGGIFNGLFTHDMWTMGEAKVYAKLEHYRAFWNSHEWRAIHYFQMLNLKGDPTMDVWKGIPREMNADYPETLPPGSNSILISVTDENDEPLQDAWVTIRQGDIGEEDIFVTGYTNEEGQIIHYFGDDGAGVVTLTVTKPHYKPHLGSFEITGVGGVTFREFISNDDISAGGNVNFVLSVRNHGNQAVNGVTGTISTNSDYIEIEEDNSAFGNIAANSNANSADNFVIEISADAPAGHRADFTLTLTDNAQNIWQSRFVLVVNNGKLEIAQFIIDDDDDGVLDPLEEARLMFHLHNAGSLDLEDVYGALTGGGYGLEIVSDTAYFGNISIEDTETSRERHFIVSTSSYVIPGMIFDLDLDLFNESGFRQRIPVKLTIGTVTVDDPLGPCPYGYWIYDCGDTDYMEAPEYEWIEIAPNLGGNGVNTGLTSNYDDIQRVVTMDLPFTFRMYGIDYDVISICANGWVTFVETEVAFQRNWRLPGPLGPDPIIAAFWDNLGLGQGAVYTYYDEEERIFIVQWQNATNVQRNEPETFQIILYDPEFYFTSTTDGPIKIQYKVFNNVNNRGGQPGGPQSQYGEWGNYCTIGISDHTGLRGLEYTFNNEYPTAARPLRNETAIFITTGSLGFTPYVAIEEVSYSNNGDNIPKFGETGDFNVRLINLGGQDAEAVTAVLTSNDNYVTILEDNAVFGDMDSEQSVNVNNAYTIQIAPNVPDGHRILFNLSISAAGNLNWNFRFDISAAAPQIRTLTPLIYDPPPGGNDNGLVDPGEELIVYLPVSNVGRANSPLANLTVTSDNELVEIVSLSENEFNTIGTGSTMYPAIAIRVSEQAQVGAGLDFDYSVESGEYLFEGSFLLGVGGVIPAQLGQGNAVTEVSAACPINIYFRSIRGQAVYTAEEIRAAGVTAGGPISELGLWIAGAPDHPLPNFRIKMRHTDAEDASNHIDGPYTTVFSPQQYIPTHGGWDMLELTTPFEWNGTDNILIDTAFSPAANWGNSGQVRYYDTENGYRFTRADSPDQSDVETTTTSNQKPQLLMLIDTSAGDASNRPENLTANLVDISRIDLFWDAPLEQQGLEGYNVYRNGLKINEDIIEETEYSDTTFDTTSVCYYYVTAVYEHRETLPSNIVAVSFNFAPGPEISPEEGNYYEPFNVTITIDSDEAVIYYTLDGSEPTEESYLYEEPFRIDYHTVVKAKAFEEGMLPSETVTVSYFILYAPRNLSADGPFESFTLHWDRPWEPEERAITSGTSARSTRMSARTDAGTGYHTVQNERTARERRNRHNTESSIKVGTGQCPVRTVRTDLLGYNIYRSFNDGDFEKLNEEPLEETHFDQTGLAEGSYRYYVTALYEAGESQGCATINIGPLSTDEEDIMPQLATSLLGAYPNPFNPETVIEFSLSDNDRVTIEIFNIAGRRVKILADDMYETGKHRLLWQGDDDSGRRLGSGVYFYRMTATGYSSTRKVLMLK